jgi:PAS domain S-box-containing protein
MSQMPRAADGPPDPPADILLVDDQPANLLALRVLLEDLGQNLVEARSGEEALRRLLHADFAVVLLDVQMDGLDGFETARLIRGRQRSRHTPIIFMTAYESPAFPVAEAYRLGAVDFLVKPLVPEILRSKVAVFVDLFRKNRQVERQAEELRRAHQEQWRVTLASIGDAVIVTDASGRVTFLNPVARDLTGRGEEAIGQQLRDVFPVIDEVTREPLEDPLARVAREGGVVVLPRHATLARHHGGDLPIDDSAAPVRDAAGAVTGVVLVFRDVHERRQAERRLRAVHATALALAESESLADAVPGLLQGLCENLGWDLGTLWLPDRTAGVLRCLESWHRPGAPAGDVTRAHQHPVPFGTGLPGRVWAQGSPAWSDDVAGEAGLHAACCFPVRLGPEVLGVLEFYSPDARPPDPGLVQVMTSVGSQVGQFLQRQRAEQAVRESEARKAAVLEAALDAIVTIDSGGRVLEINSAAERLFGRPRADVLGRPLVEQIVPPAWRDRHPGGLAPYLTAGEGPDLGRRVEVSALRADGTEFPAELAVVRIAGAGSPVFTAYVRDLTEQKRAEETRRRAAELARSNAELEQFAYVASHDLQEPLRQIRIYLQLLQERCRDRLDEAAGRFLGHAVEGAARLKELVTSLLAYARVGSRARPLVPTDCAAAFDEALASLGEAVRESGASVTRGPLPTVLADAGQLAQLFQNLLGNAIKFRGPRPPQVHAEAVGGGGEWRFTIRDNGIGIDPRHAQRIFVLFERLHGRDQYAGTGIGLAVCKRIVERHGGCIGVESKPGEGSAFWFTLPASGGHA